MISFIVFVLLVFATLLSALGAFEIKKAANKYNLFNIWKSKSLYQGLSVYGISTAIYIVILKGEELSVVYPLVSTVYIWTTILSIKYLGEKMDKWKWLGLIGIFIGVTLIGIGS